MKQLMLSSLRYAFLIVFYLINKDFCWIKLYGLQDLRTAVLSQRLVIYGLRSMLCSLKSAVCSLQSAVCKCQTPSAVHLQVQ